MYHGWCVVGKENVGNQKKCIFRCEPFYTKATPSTAFRRTYPRSLAEWPLVVTQHRSMPPRFWWRNPNYLPSWDMAPTFEIQDCGIKNSINVGFELIQPVVHPKFTPNGMESDNHGRPKTMNLRFGDDRQKSRSVFQGSVHFNIPIFIVW